jgi:hypothetical protein
MMSFGIKISHSTSSSFTSWLENNIIKPGKKWYLPLDAFNEMKTNCLEISPVNEEGEEIYGKQSLNWNSNSFDELISFEEKIFIQV